MASGSDAIPTRRALITGAGSGTGAATAIALAATHELVLVGRRRDRLEATADRVTAAGGTAEIAELDVARGDAGSLLETVGPVTDLVLAAGLNRPRRTWDDHDRQEFRNIVFTNLIGVADVITAFLPGLRRAGGTVVVVSSLSAWTTSPGAGVAYRASKMALRAVTESLNEQEFAHGVRATHLCPGDIDTDFVSQRPAPPTPEQRRAMLSPDDVARAVVFVLASPPHVRIDELVISPLGAVER
jgi:NADP-dependent 3-hydroxy acid dehydrogenase YdfG